MLKQTIMKVVIFLTAILINTSVSAQSAFQKGTKLFDVGIGMGSSGLNAYFDGRSPVNFRVGLEVGVTDQVSVGGSLSYAHSGFSFEDEHGKARFGISSHFLSGRASYHFHVNERLDPYAGAALAFGRLSPEFDDVEQSYCGMVGHSAYAGMRYYFGQKLALNGELAISNFSLFHVGLSYKF